MSDSGSTYSDAQVVQSHADQLLQLHSQLIASAEKLGANGYSTEIAEVISNELLHVKRSLGDFECGLQLVKDLAVANQLVATRPDHRSLRVIRFCLEELADYLAVLAEQGVDDPVGLLLAFNELAALHKKPLLTENLLSVPDDYRIDSGVLQLFDLKAESVPLTDGYLGFSQIMLGVYRGEERQQKLQELSGSFSNLAEIASNQKAREFWLLCKAFVSTVRLPKGELSPALLSLFKEIEGVLFFALGDAQHQVLGMQQKVDRVLVNLLCYTPADDLPRYFVEGAAKFSDVRSEINGLHQSSPDQYSLWLQTSIRVLAERLQHCSAVLAEEALDSEEVTADFLEEIALLKRLLVLTGVHGVRENLQEVETLLRSSVSSENMQSCSTSILLVEQQMLYQFSFLKRSAELDDSEPSGLVETEQLKADKSLATSDCNTAQTAEPFDRTVQDFGARCNLCIDVIQQSLDTALGSSGNLIPDSSVINALTQLNDLVAAEGIDELTGLLTPLSKLLIKAEDSTLNQSETLLVQEAIIAATLGIDSLMGRKPLPDLVADVTGRLDEVLQTTSERLNRSNRNSSLSGFLTEAEELLPRLFELFQRLRSAPGASRLYGEINRLLHTLKVSADVADEQQLAEVAHSLEATMVDLTHSDATASREFFDIAIETIECLDEDIERLRNSESPVDRGDLIDRLRLEGAIEEAGETLQKVSPVEGKDQAEKQPSLIPAWEPADKPTGVVVQKGSTLSSDPIDWSARFRQVETYCAAIGNSHEQLLDLQKRTEQIFKSVAHDQVGLAAESNKALRSFAEQLQQISTNQGIAIKALTGELGNASRLDAAQLGSSLLTIVETAADDQGLRLQFGFESNGVLIHKNLFDQLTMAITGLLGSIVAHTFPDNESEALPNLSVSVQQTGQALFIDVADNGSGVRVEGSVPRSDNPWAQVARPDWQEVSQATIVPPRVLSVQSDRVVEISGLLKVASRYGGSVAIRSSANTGARYRLCLPMLETIQDVLVVAVNDQLLAVPATKVESVGFANQDNIPSLASLLGTKGRAAFDHSQEDQFIAVRTKAGVAKYSVAKVIGPRKLTFTTADRVLPDVPGYIGVAVIESEQLVMLLDVDYWVAQGH